LLTTFHLFQRNIEEREDEVTSVNMTFNEKDKVIRDLQHQVQQLKASQEKSSGGGDAVAMVNYLQSELLVRFYIVKFLYRQRRKY